MALPTASSIAAGAAGVRGDRLPPYSEEAERGVLGSALLDAERVMDLCLGRRLGPDAFYLRAHSTLFEVLSDMLQAGRPIDLLTVSETLKDAGELDVVGGGAYLDQLVDSTPTAAHAEYYIDIVRQKALLRTVIDRSRQAIDACYATEEDADEILGQTEQSFFEIADLSRSGVLSWPDLIKASVTEIEQIFATRKGLTGLPTGFQNIDKLLMGLKPSDMMILAARPSMGKTSLAMNVVEHVATGYRSCAGYHDQAARPVAVFSLEMSGEQLVRRMVCCCAGVPSHKLSDGRFLSAKHHRDLINAADVLNKAQIFLDDTPGLSALELRSRARRLKRRHDVGLIVIDYLQLLNYPQYAKEGRQRETAAISGALKAMAKELRVPVLVLSQLSRAPETRDRLAQPKLSDLRDSGSIEQDADVVLLLRRPCKYPDDPEAEDSTLAVLDVAKHRNGPTGHVKLNFEDEVTRFTDRARGGVDPMDGPGEDPEDEPL